VPDPKQRPWVRIIIEKPFGRSLESAVALNACVRRAFAEHQVYRIDHYLGKETVQNLLVFRFANSIFEPVWNRQHVHHVQITAAESVGVEHRGKYYEEAGVVRDMFQNHLLQLLTLTAMEPPVTFSADAVRDEKVKALRAIRPITPAVMHEYAVRGQYGPGTIDGKPVPGYRQEPDVAPDSATLTYCAIRFMIDNWRWQGVPFYLRSAKRMPRRATEIAIQFRTPPHVMFPLPEDRTLEPNVIAIRVQPEEGIGLRFEVKIPGIEVNMASVTMDFGYAEAFGGLDHDAYETLLLDCMLGEATLFTRSDEVEAAWGVVDPIVDFWSGKRPEHFPNYAAGTWGPAVADEFIAREGAKWREP
jgi:glucose-6-phosphate 1-dehydrogenase